MTERLAYRIHEFAEAIGVSRSKAYEIVASGEVPSIKVGGCLRIPVDSARGYIAQQLAARMPNDDARQAAGV
jgi:excisionase family DNA binding protein